MRFLLHRTVFYLVTAWAAVTIDFLIPRLLPGTPVQAAMARFQLPPEAEHSIEVAFGVHPHESLIAQYFSYWGNVLHGNLGVSFTYYPAPVSTVVGQTLPWTVGLVGVSTIIAWFLGTLLGILAGWFRGSWFDLSVPAGAFFRGIPTFWIGTLLILVLGVFLHWFPVSGGYASELSPGWTLAFVGSLLKHAILPAVTIVLGSMAGHLLGMRNMMVTVLGEDYVIAAEAKGLPQHRIMLGYAARNAILPSVVTFALELGFVVSGALLVEQVFSFPGIGYTLFQAIVNQDYPLLQAIFLIITLAVLIANLLADVAFVLVDPRTRQARG